MSLSSLYSAREESDARQDLEARMAFDARKRGLPPPVLETTQGLRSPPTPL